MVDRFYYSPGVLRTTAGSSVALDAIGDGYDLSTSLAVQRLNNPWDAVQAPGPDMAVGSGFYIPYADAADAYIEVRPTEIEFLSGPYSAAGVNPITGTTTNRDGTTWNGIANALTINTRFGFGTNFNPLAEAIYWAGEGGATGQEDAEGRMVVRINGDLRATGAGSQRSTRIGGPTGAQKNQETFWRTGTGAANANTNTPRAVQGLWLVGANWTPGTKPETTRPTDRIASIFLGYNSSGSANSGFYVCDVTFQGLHIANDEAGGETRAFGGTGDPSANAFHGLLRIWDCYVSGGINPTSFDDLRGFPTGAQFHIRFFHSRGCYHIANTHFGPVKEHCTYVDFINDNGPFVDSLPWYYQRRSYFKNCTMEYCQKTFLQVVNRANELPEEVPDDDTNVKLWESAQGMILIEGNVMQGHTGDPAAVTIVGLISYDRFPEDGTVIMRNNEWRENDQNDTYTDGSGNVIYNANSGPCFLTWNDGGANHGTFFDDYGHATTRVVIDGHKTFDKNGNPAPQYTGSDLFKFNQTADVQIWLDATNWDVAPPPQRSIFHFDFDASALHFAGNPKSNNPAATTTLYGASRTKGTYKAHNGSVRFMFNPSQVTDVRNYPGWNGAGSSIARMYDFVGTPITLTTQDLNALAWDITADTLQTGLSVGAKGTSVAADISGSTSIVGPGFDGTSDYFLQNRHGFGYVMVPEFDRSELHAYAVVLPTGAVVAAMFRLEIQQSGAAVTDIASLRVTPFVASAQTSETYSTDLATLTVTPLTAVWSVTQDYGFEAGINMPKLEYFKFPAFKNWFWSSRAYQYRNTTTGVIYPPNEGLGGFTVALDANGHPDFNNFPAGVPAGSTVVSNIYQAQPADPNPSGPYSIRWTGTGVIDFLPTNQVGNETGRSDPGNNFVERNLSSASAGIYIEIKSGPVNQVQVFPPGYDPLDDPNQFQYTWQPILDRVPEVMTPGGPVRVVHWTGQEFCGQGTYAGGSQLTIKGWLPGPDAYAPYKLLSDPRWSEDKDQSISGVPIEAQVQLATEMGRWLWWNCPHELGDEQIRYQLEYIRNNLVPQGLGVILEFSNEIWNTNYPVYYWAYDNAGGVHFGNPAFQAFVGSRIQNFFSIAETVFAGIPQFLIKGVMGFAGLSSYTQGVLNAVTSSVQFLGCAGYLNVNNNILAGEYSSATTAQDILDDLTANIPTLEARMNSHKSIANARQASQGSPCRFVLYEAGQSVVPDLDGPNANSWLSAAIQCQHAPGMFDVYVQLQEMYDRAGVDYLNWYAGPDPVEDRFGMWGHLSSFGHVTGDGQDPKWDAIARGTFGSNVRKPDVATLTVSSLIASPQVGGNILVSLATLTVTGLEATPDEFLVSAPLADLTISALETDAGGPAPAVTIASLTVSALQPAYADNAFSPFVTNFDYTLPAALQDAYNVLNVFGADDDAEPVFAQNRPILISCLAGNYSQKLPETLIRSALHPLEYQWLASGGLVVSVGVTGFQRGGVFDGVESSTWFSLVSNPIPEKDAAQIIKAVRQFATTWGGDASFIAWAGTSSGGLTGAVLLNPQLDFPGDQSEQGLQSTRLNALVQFSPKSWWPAVTQDFPAFHWPTNIGNQATTLAQVPLDIQEAVSFSTWLRSDGYVSQTRVFMAADEPHISANLTRDAEGDPTLYNALDWRVQLHPLWEAIIARQDLDNRNEAIHDDRSILAVSNNLGAIPVNFGPYVDERFDGGVYGTEIRTRAHDWLWEQYYARDAEIATLTVTGLTAADVSDVGVQVDLAGLTVTGLTANWFEGTNKPAEVAELTVSALAFSGFQYPTALASLRVTALNASGQSFDDNYGFADIAALVVFALRATTPEEGRYPPGFQLTQDRVVKAEIVQ